MRQVWRLRSAEETASITCSRAVSVSQWRPARILDTHRLVDGEGERQGVDGIATLGFGAAAAFQHDAADIVLGHLAAADGPLHVEEAALGLAAAEIDRDRAQPGIGHVLGLADGSANGTFRLNRDR